MTSHGRLTPLALLLVAAPLAAAPVPAVKHDPPAVVVQLASAERLWDELIGLVKSHEPKLAEEFQQSMAAVQGEGGWHGLDEKQPIGLAFYPKEKVEESFAVVALPITSEKKLLAMLERLEFTADPEKDADGVRRVRHKETIPDGFPVRLRVVDGFAYVGLNAPAAALTSAKIIPAGDLIDAKETVPVRVTIFPARVPKAFRELVGPLWAEGKKKEVKPAEGDGREREEREPMFKTWAPLATAFRKWADANTAGLFDDAESVTAKLKTDPKAGEYTFEVVVTPRADTPLAKQIAAIKPTAGRFHQLATKDVVAGGWLTAGPGCPKGLREKGGPFLAEFLAMFESGASEVVRPVLAEFSKAVTAAVTGGTADLGFAVFGPDKDGHYTGVAGVAVADAPALEKAFGAMAKKLTKEAGVTLDAEKAGELTVHTVTLPDVADGWREKVLGKGAAVRVAFGKDAVYLAVGPDGAKQIERAAKLKPITCKGTDFLAHPAKVENLCLAVAEGKDVDVTWGIYLSCVVFSLGEEDALRSHFGLDVTGGKQLTITHNQYRLWPLLRTTGPLFHR